MKTDSTSNPVLNALRSLRKTTTRSQKQKLLVLALMIFVSATMDVIGLAAVIPLLKVGTDPSAVESNQILHSIYDFFNFSSYDQFLIFLIVTIMVYFVLKSAFGVFVTWFQARLSANMAVHLTREQFDKYFKLHYIDFSKIKSSLLIRNMFYNPASYVQWIIQPFLMLFSEGVILLLIVGGIAVYNLFLFVFILLTIGPATWLVYRLLKNRGARLGAALDATFPFALASLTEAIAGYVDIKLAGREKYYRKKYLNHLGHYMQLQQSIYLQSQIPLRTNELIALTGIILIFVYALLFEGGNENVLVMVGVFAAAAYRLMPSLNRILSAMMYINNNQVSIDNLFMFDNLVPDNVSETRSSSPVPFKNNITFHDITFKFPDSKKPVIDHVNITVKKGERVGFVGASGSGKTTLMNLLLRFYNEDEGKISVDGVTLDSSNQIAWQRSIGYVKQDIFILDGTIRENIVMGDENVDEAQLQSALKQSSLDGFVNSLPAGINTLVGEKGGNLSGGQRQRIGIARSLYRNAEILVFDEATSALDTKTEQEVTEAIDTLSTTNKTIFIIAHRITTLKNCDKIIELKNGQVTGTYTYDELIKKMI